MKIRTLDLIDIPNVAIFEREISLISFGNEGIDSIEFYIKKLKKVLHTKENYMYVAEKDDMICGWLWFSKRTNFITNDAYCDFKSFYILNEYRGTEVSDLLIKKLIEISKKQQMNKIVGRVEANNINMRFLYKKYGFIPKHITMEYTVKDKEN